MVNNTTTTLGIIKLTRHGVSPKKFYKIFEVNMEMTLYRLAAVINELLGFRFDHMFGFYTTTNPRNISKADKIFELFADEGLIDDPIGTYKTQPRKVRTNRVKSLFKDHKEALFVFDYGVGWNFILTFLGTKTVKGKLPSTYYRLIEKKGKNPIQYPPLD